MRSLSEYCCMVLLIIVNTVRLQALSFNMPNLCPNVSWNETSTTFASNGTVSVVSRGLFINRNNTIVFANALTGQIFIWYNGDRDQNTTINANLSSPLGVFITEEDEILVSHNKSGGQVDRWSLKNKTFLGSIPIGGECHGLFVDIDNNLYCSERDLNQVIVYSLDDPKYPMTRVLGTGCHGSSMSSLKGPRGIFVTMQKDLYVADYENHRIQLFRYGDNDAITVAGNGSNSTFPIPRPIGIVLDGDSVMYIAEAQNNRIVRFSPQDTKCIIGCTGILNPLNFPFTARFDNQGNLFVLDARNIRIRKYNIIPSTCNQTANLVTAVSTTSTTNLITSTQNTTTISPVQRRGNSYNRPKISPKAVWNFNGTIIATNSTLGTIPLALFVNIDNTVFSTSFYTGQVFMWYNGSNHSNASTTIETNGTNTFNIFATTGDHLFISNLRSDYRIEQWSITNQTLISSISVEHACYALFMDTDDNLYCSLTIIHKIVMLLTNNISNAVTTVAGTGCAGSAPWMLHSPHGIFITSNKDIYVADHENDRIQLFQFGQRSAITVAGNGSNVTFVIRGPTGIVLDADGDMYIVEWDSHRVVRSSVQGTKCILGCSGSPGSAPYQFYHPRFAYFDTYGNLFVLEYSNSRIQKFELIYNEFDNATSPTSFNPARCANVSTIGSFCNVSSNPCDVLQPCLNNGSCSNNNISIVGYSCSCLSHFVGDQCQIDLRPCALSPCMNGGTCSVTNTTYRCECTSEWEGNQCQTQKDYCTLISCQNGGVCRSISSNYTCICLGDSYSGEFCEIKSTKTALLQAFATSVSYISIIIILTFSFIIVMMDVLKYALHIHPESKQSSKTPKVKKSRRPPTILHFVYVNDHEYESNMNL